MARNLQTKVKKNIYFYLNFQSLNLDITYKSEIAGDIQDALDVVLPLLTFKAIHSLFFNFYVKVSLGAFIIFKTRENKILYWAIYYIIGM